MERSDPPGAVSNINAIDFYDIRPGYAIDGNKTVFVTDDGRTWAKLGSEIADHNFFGVDTDGTDDITVSGGGWTIFNWAGTQWVRMDTGDTDLRDGEADDTTAITLGGGGAVFRRTDTG